MGYTRKRYTRKHNLKRGGAETRNRSILLNILQKLIEDDPDDVSIRDLKVKLEDYNKSNAHTFNVKHTLITSITNLKSKLELKLNSLIDDLINEINKNS
jgi:hypothetical protein